MYQRFENCKVSEPRWDDRYRVLAFNILDSEGGIHPINIQTRRQRLEEEISMVANGTLGRGIFACGMTDIDMWAQSNGDVLVEWSPCESQLLAFLVPASGFVPLVDWARGRGA